MGTSPIAGELQWTEAERIAPTRPADEHDAVDGMRPVRTFTPENVDQLSALLRWCHEHRVAIIPRGGGTKRNWGNLPHSASAVVCMEKFSNIVDHAWQDMTVTVEGGVPIARLQDELAKRGQRLPLDVLWPERSTVGGVIATNDSGSLRQRFGSVRDLLLGVTVVLADGTIARSGGRVVKNVAGYDLPKLFTGSFGTLGVIAEATLRTYPLPHCARSVSFRFSDASSANRFLLALSDSNLVPAAAQMRISHGERPIVDIRLEGIESGVEDQRKRLTQMATTAEPLETPSDAWNREACFEDSEAIVGKFSVLPTRLSEAVETLRGRCPETRIIVQSIGLGLLSGHLREVSSLFDAIRKIGGTLVLLQAPADLKRNLDVFGPLPSGYPIMVRLKQRFDPNGILSPGRFVGGI